MQKQSKLQEETSDDSDDDAAEKSSSRKDLERRRRLRRRRALHLAHRLRRRNFMATSTTSTSSEDVAVPRASGSQRRRRRRCVCIRRPRNELPALGNVQEEHWIWEIQLDWLECFFFSLSVAVGVMLLGPHIQLWTQVGPIPMTWYLYGFIICCSLSAILAIFCVIHDLAN